jgi:uncharacterized membrane protein (UPF0127 family)
VSNDPGSTGQRGLAELRRGDRVQARNLTRGTLLAAELRLALGPLARLRGLLGRPRLAAEAGLLLRPCTGVHTFFMSYPIDVLFLDAGGQILELRAELAPFRATALLLEARAVLELAPGRAAATATVRGDRVGFELVED